MTNYLGRDEIAIQMKKLTLVLPAFLFLLLETQQAFADTPLKINPPTGVVPGNVEPTQVVTFILTVLVAIGVVASIIFLIMGGIKWTTSSGDKQAVEAARNQIVASIIGLVVILVSFVIIRFVLRLLGAPDVFDYTIPNLTGAASVGSPCTDHSQCASGVCSPAQRKCI